MNERIKELVEQAGFQYINEEGIGWAGNHNASLPKFAELIVSKCIELMDENYRDDMYTGDVFASEYNNCINEQVQALEDYFGVNK
jgi:hypothetical protein